MTKGPPISIALTGYTMHEVVYGNTCLSPRPVAGKIFVVVWRANSYDETVDLVGTESTADTAYDLQVLEIALIQDAECISRQTRIFKLDNAVIHRLHTKKCFWRK